jgi:AbrB family looped-hinge helix DNA binding protein
MTDLKLFTGRVGKGGQITIPAQIRKEEGIGVGDYVVVHIGKVQK